MAHLPESSPTAFVRGELTSQLPGLPVTAFSKVMLRSVGSQSAQARLYFGRAVRKVEPEPYGRLSRPLIFVHQDGRRAVLRNRKMNGASKPGFAFVGIKPLSLLAANVKPKRAPSYAGALSAHVATMRFDNGSVNCAAARMKCRNKAPTATTSEERG